jgi:dihydroorotate dehydrogenase electron transfer subunit
MAVFRGHAAAQKSDSGRIEVLYRIAGRGTQLLSEARVGQALSLVGPLGLGFDPISATERPVLVGGGTGIASLYELAARGAKGNDRLEVVLGARTEGDLMAVEDFRVLPVRLHLTTEDGSCGIRGRTTDVVRDLLGERAEGTTLYSCGPTPMMEACAKLALETSAECRVSLENTMACGSGICLGCAVPVRSGGYSLVCRDGPVFDAREVVWEGLP